MADVLELPVVKNIFLEPIIQICLEQLEGIHDYSQHLHKRTNRTLGVRA